MSYPSLINIARVAAIIACVGLLYSPSVATIGLIAAYVVFLAGRQEAVGRFKEVIARPLGYWGLAFLGVVFLGMIYASVSWHDRWMDLYKWRTMLWMFVLLALFDEARWKERFLLTFLAATGVAVLASSFSVIVGIPIWRGAHEVLRNSGTQGMAFACAALVCVWITLGKKQVGVNHGVLSVLGLLYVMNIVFITNSRSGYVVLGGGLAILLLWNAPLKKGALIVVSLLAAGGLAFASEPAKDPGLEVVDHGVHRGHKEQGQDG